MLLFPDCDLHGMTNMKKNLLFITADQWRGEYLSLLGHQVRTPNLDALANEAMLFTRHFANSAPCGPSRASMHTGMYMQNHRSATNGTPLDARHTNWAQELRKAGFDPVLFGYTDTSHDPRNFATDAPEVRTYQGVLPGIREIVHLGDFPDRWADWLAEKGYTIPEPNWKLYRNKKQSIEWEDGAPHPAALNIPAHHHDTCFMVDKTLEFIEQQQDNWMIHLSLLRPHPPWVAPEPYNKMYPPADVPGFIRAAEPVNEAMQHPFLDYLLQRDGISAPGNERKLRRLKASYQGLMSEVDTQLGRIFAHLKQTGEWDNTLLIFTSDHGEQMGDHWLMGKLGYFDQSYHIPLIIRDPEQKQQHGKQINCFTEGVDIMPTILDFFQQSIPTQCDGRSLLPILKTADVPQNWRQEAHWEFDFRDVQNGLPEQRLGISQHQCSLNVIRSEKYKYVHFSALPALFFNLEEDPNELVNLVDNPEYTELILEFAQKMLSWRMTHDEQLLTHQTLTNQGVFSRPSERYLN